MITDQQVISFSESVRDEKLEASAGARAKSYFFQTTITARTTGK